MTTSASDTVAFSALFPSPPGWLINTAVQAVVPGTCTYIARRRRWSIEPSFMAFTVAFCALRLPLNILEELAINPVNEYAISKKKLYDDGKQKITTLCTTNAPHLKAVFFITGFLFAEFHKPTSPISLALYGSCGLLMSAMWTKA